MSKERKETTIDGVPMGVIAKRMLIDGAGPKNIVDGVPMGIIIELDAEGRGTAPPNMGYRNDEWYVLLTNILRECCSNAENFGAGKAFAIVLFAYGHSWLWFFHDGKPFKGLENDIIPLGVTPYRSNFVEKSFQGNGIVESSGAAHTDPLLVIWSRTPKGVKVGSGHGLENNEWRTYDCTNVWIPILNELVGKVLKNFKVGYGFKVNLEGYKSPKERNFLTARLTNQLAMMAPSMLQKVKLSFCEKQIGWPYRNLQMRAQYATLEKFRAGRSTGSARRYALSLQGLVNRYVDGEWKIPCEPFTVYDASRGESLVISDAHLLVRYWPAMRFRLSDDNKKIKDNRARWHIVLRNGQDAEGTYTVEQERETGCKPSRKCFLSIPWLADFLCEKYADEAERFRRFQDNTLGLYRDTRTLMANMNLPYAEKDEDAPRQGGNEYMTIDVVINKVDAIARKRGGKTDRVPATAKAIFDMLGRRSDFTVAKADVVRNIMKKAAEKAANNVPEDLKELCNRIFVQDTTDFVPIDMGGIGPDVPPTRRESPVIMFNLEDNGDVFNGKFEAGKQYKLAAWHKTQKRWLHLDEIEELAGTRGFTLSNETDWGVEDAMANAIGYVNSLIDIPRPR